MRILVTAAGRAIGKTICSTLASAGHEVIATARTVSMLDELSVAAKLSLDVTDAHSVDRALTDAGEIDVIVNNAALPGSAPLESFPLDHLRAMFETNVIGPLGLVQRLLPGGANAAVGRSSISVPFKDACRRLSRVPTPPPNSLSKRSQRRCTTNWATPPHPGADDH
jgi:NAD(P)-dependent dehydrogenase (short-subunit alcohol dehydrogenase family)